MNIKKISLNASGFKGATVVYLREEEKNGHPFINEVTEKRKHPIHLSLEKMFKDLRYHLLDITGLIDGSEEKNEKDFMLLETDVTGIEFDAAGFTIIGEKKVFADKTFKLKTCRVEEEDMYEHFDTVQALIASIVEETKEYMAGTKKVDDDEVIQRWLAAGKNVKLSNGEVLTEETMNNYTSDQLKEFAISLIENKFGGVVLIQDSAALSEEEVKAVNEEISAANEIIIIDAETVIPVPVSKPKKEKKAKEKSVEAQPIAEPLPPAF